ncbi:MAG: hypothetical protein RLZZ319_212 [Actinomycetota bacterium]
MIDVPAEDFPIDVRITRVTSPGGKNVAILVLDNGDERRPETLGPVGLDRLDAAITAAADADTDALIVTGSGRTFCAGANLDMLSSPRHFGDALQVAQEGHRVMRRLGELGIPTVAALNGTALGGGFELALHCTHRVAQSGKAPLGLPEVGLGLIPGWGGATLLPRIVGMSAALTVMIDNALAGKFLDSASALALGAVDAVDDDAVTGALALIDGYDGTTRPNALDGANTTDALDAVFARALGRSGNPIDALTHLRRILDHSTSLTVTELFEAEDAALADLTMTAEFRRRLYAFRVTSAASKPPTGTPNVEPRTVGRVGVVGAGLMASQIAQVFAERLAVPVHITDIDQSRLDAAVERVGSALDVRVAKGSLAADTRREILDRIHTTLDVADFAECDLVIEAVFEDLAVKKDVLSALDDVVSADAILASNTSSLSVDAMAGFLGDPTRMAGIHFFNPVGVMKLVEVVRAPRMSDDALATAIDVTRKLGKTPVIVADEAGFVVNRLLSVFLGEALRLVESGVTPTAISDALAPLRLPMSPFALIDLIGRTVTLKMMQSLERFAPDRFFVGNSLVDLTANPANPMIAADLDARGGAVRELPDTEIHNFIVDALAREVRIMLDTEVVASAREIDLCMMNGAGWPAAIGGITPYLDGCGASERATGALLHPDADFA